MKILLVNPNTSAFVTAAVTAEAERAAAPGTEIRGVTGEMGASIIGCRSENAIGTHSAMELAAAHADDCDAVLLAVSFDSALAELRELLAVPVVGMTEAAMLTACMVGDRFALLSFGDRAMPLYERLAHIYGLRDRFAGAFALRQLTPEELRDPGIIIPLIKEEAARTIERTRAEAIILAGAVFAGLARDLRDEVPVPVLDGISCGVAMAEMLVRLDLAKPTAGSYRHPRAQGMTSLGPGLTKLYRSLPG